MDVSTFLAGGGEMGALTRSYDWAASPIGPPDQWPQSLLTTVSILLNSKFPMFLWWGEDHIQFYNDAYRPSMGDEGKHPTALGQKGKECWPEIWPTIYPLMRQVLDGGESTWLEDALIPIFRNGQMEDVYWTFSYSPVKGETGKVEGVLVVCTETTQSVQNLQKIQISEQRFNNLVRVASIGIIILEGENMLATLVNEAYSKLIGRSAEEILGRELFSIIPEAEDTFRPMLNQVRLTGESVYLYDQPYLVYCNSNTIEGYLNVAFEPYREADGSISGVMAIFQDVTKQVLSVKKIQETEAAASSTANRLELALAAARLGSFEYMFDTREVTCNEQCRLHLGLPLEGTINYEDIEAVILSSDKERKQHAMNEAVKNHQAYNAEYRISWSDGSIRWIRVAGNPIYKDNGEPLKVVGVTIDITEHKLFAEELSRQVNERTLALQRSNDDLQQFAHITSHDLKEPVRKIKIWSGRLKDDSGDRLSEQSKFYLSRLQHATDRIQIMIDSILSFSSVSSSNEEIEQVDLNDVINQVATDLEMLILEKNAVIHRELLPTIEGSGILLFQLFYNLIYNSLKFSKKEEPPVITITAKLHNLNSIDAVTIRVSDNGIGFDNKYKSTIFSAFTRLNSKDTYEGTGLGLGLCQKVVERHRGVISASGEKNKGATFSITLPLRQTERTLQHVLSRSENEDMFSEEEL